MGHDQRQKIAFLCVSFNIGCFLGYQKVKAAFPDIPSELRKRIAYATRFDDSERATLKNALANHPETESMIDSFFCNPLVHEIGSDPLIENRTLLVLREFNPFIAHRLGVRLTKASVVGVGEWLKDIERYYEYDDQFTDFYIEGCYALALQKTGMIVKMKPYGDKGPDLQISIRCLSFDAEISRFRRDISLGNKMSLDKNDSSLLIEMPCKSQNVWSKIEDKVGQLREDKNGIILLLSDNIGIDWIEFEKNAEHISCFGEKLSAVIFTDKSGKIKSHLNPCARIPTQELTHNLQEVVEALQGLRAYGYFWQNDLQRMCNAREHLYHS